MAYKDLTFLLFAKDMSASRGFEKVAASGDAMGKGLTGSMGLAGVAIAGLAISVAAKSVKMAADFETATTRIITDGGGAGESMAKLSDVIQSAGVATGTSMDEAAKAMYKVSSAGYTLANGGAAVLKAALEGAAIGGADTITVADALTTVMTDFNIPASKAADTMSKLTETVSTGKTNLNDLAGSLHSVLPGASAAGLGLAEVLSAVGTMTAEGISADQATQNLNHSILALQAPSDVAKAAMGGIGLSSLDVAKNLGKRGLAGTYEYLLTAMAKHSHAGLIAVNTFAQTAQAASAMKTEMAGLPASLRPAALAFESGHLTSKQWAATLKTYPAITANLGKQFATTVKHATGFSDALKSGSGPMRTAAAQLEKMLGGTTGLQVALHLTGDHMDVFLKNTKKIASSTTEAGGHVKGWAETQKTFNQHMKDANAYMGSFMTKTGQDLLPALVSIMDTFPHVAKAVQKFNKDFMGMLKDIGAGFSDGWNQIVTYFETIPAKLLNIGGQVVQGLWNGISGNWGGMMKNIAGLIGSVPDLFKSILKIHSPSKVFFDIGTYIGQGLEKGLLGSSSAVQSASSTLAGQVISAFKAKHSTMSSGTENSLLGLITGDEKQLSAIANNRAGLQSKLGNLKSSRSGVYDSTKSGTLAAGDITSFSAPGDAVGGLRSLVGKTKTFTSDLRSLMRKGVSGEMLNQLVNGWASNPDGALATANGLLANTGDLKQILTLERQLNAAAGGLGSASAHGEYDSQINATQGKIRVDTWRMQQLARNEAKRVAGGLHVTVNVSGVYAGTKESLGKTFAQVMRDEVRKGTIPKNWATG